MSHDRVADGEVADNPQRLCIAFKTIVKTGNSYQPIQFSFCDVTEGRMPEIMCQACGFGGIWIDPAETLGFLRVSEEEDIGNRPRQLSDFE